MAGTTVGDGEPRGLAQFAAQLARARLALSSSRGAIASSRRQITQGHDLIGLTVKRIARANVLVDTLTAQRTTPLC